MKVSIELNLLEDGREFLNYWDFNHGNDVVAQLVDGKIMLNEYDDAGNEAVSREITFQEFVNEVKKVV